MRAISPRLADCALTHLEPAPIDVALAIAQHDAYRQALGAAGLRVRPLPPLDDAPDGVFVEDTALLLGNHAVITRPGAASRAGEAESTAAGLAAEDFVVHRLGEGSLDGGDVLRIGDTLYVGLSTRTDAIAAAALQRIAEPLGYKVATIAFRGCLHLKTGITYAGPDGSGRPVLLYNPDWISPGDFGGVEPLAVAADEPFAANILRIGDTILIAAGSPQTRDRLASRGFRVTELDVSELQKAEAGLTCMSLISAEPALAS